MSELRVTLVKCTELEEGDYLLVSVPDGDLDEGYRWAKEIFKDIPCTVGVHPKSTEVQVIRKRSKSARQLRTKSLKN